MRDPFFLDHDAFHADLGGVAVHQRGKGLFAASHMFGQGDRGIIAGLDRHALFHVFQARGLVDREAAVAAIGAGTAAALLRKNDPSLKDIDVQFFGDTQPLTTTGLRASDPKNRRVEILIVPAQQ